MISEKSLSKKWIESFRQQPEYARIDLMILEKMIHALSLVELIQLKGIEFVFKGGTSLSLLLDTPRRFSIDIDILTLMDKTLLEEKLNTVCADSKFSRFEENVRSNQNNDIPKAHYKFYYESKINGRENYVLLDILFEKSHYPQLIDCEVNNLFLDIEGEVTKVKTPSINSIAGDKLTAFAPNTIGIRFNNNKSQEIIKQLFDIGYLFDELTDFSEVSKAYNNIAPNEIEYRSLDKSIEETLQDTIETGFIIARRVSNRDTDLVKFNEVIKGIREFASFTIGGRFVLDNAIEFSAKAALLAAKIKTENYDPLEPFDETAGIRSYMIEEPEYNFLNRLSRLPNKALYYWNNTIKLIA